MNTGVGKSIGRPYAKGGIAPRQIKAIHATIGKLGLDDDTYRAMLQDRYHVGSCKDLTWRQAEELLDSLNGKGFSRSPASAPRSRWSELDGRPGMASGAQCRKIAAMWAEVSRMSGDEERERALWSFLRRIVGVDHFRFLRGWQVQKVIAAIEAMKFNNKEV
ncbi:regulatory protein GemA [Geobacter sp.]|uniref:regulatory protein GemA n=1 Tax=Geobacter sp. TaxID=46610 RepID=UPI002620838C|nr:regulatory protein GemA [Geobacter sp.]